MAVPELGNFSLSLAAGGAATEDSGPAHFMLTDPDGNQLLFDQF